MLDFVLPTEQHRTDVTAFYAELDGKEETCIGFADHNDYDRWLCGMRNRHDGKNLPKGYVRENFYLCYDDAALVGVFSLKFSLTPFLLQYGGHIGYAVRPSKRCRGYATQMLQQGKEMAKQFGLDRLLCVCDDDNFASEKVICKNGGVLENTLYDPDEKVTVKRFWITL